MTNLDRLVAVLENARDTKNYCYVEVTIPGQDTTEIIFNHKDAIDNKIAYYLSMYNEDCVHRHCSDIRIVRAGGMMGLDMHDCTEEVFRVFAKEE